MLGTTFYFIVIFGLLAAVIMDGAAVFARAGLSAAAEHVVTGGVDDAVVHYQQALANTIEADPAIQSLHTPQLFTGTPPPVGVLSAAQAPPPTVTGTQTPPPSSTATGPRFTVQYYVTPTRVAAPTCGSAGSPQGSDVIGWLQCEGFVQESRLSLHVVVTVWDATQTQLYVQRDQYVTLRLFGQPPYSAVTGRMDASAADATGVAPGTSVHEGDVGGDTVSGEPVPVASPYPSGGTLIHVQYQCQPGGAGQTCTQAAPPDPDAQHLKQGASWSNGNAAIP